MICKIDNKAVFEGEEFNTTFCEACEHFCKIYHYRACEERHKWNLEKGIDVFSQQQMLDKIAGVQQKAPVDPTSPQSKQSPPKKDPRNTRHRGRR